MQVTLQNRFNAARRVGNISVFECIKLCRVNANFYFNKNKNDNGGNNTEIRVNKFDNTILRAPNTLTFLLSV